MAAIPVTSNDTIKLIVTRADDQVVAYLNGMQVYTKTVAHPAAVEDEIDISGQLREGYNVLLILGVQWGGTYTFKVEVKKNDGTIALYDESYGASDADLGVVWDVHLEFWREG